MTTLKEVVQVLATLAQRGAMTDEELERILGNFLSSGPAPQISQRDGKSQMVSDLPSSPTSPQSAVPSKRRQRQSEGRGSYGWVDQNIARGLVLVAVLELGGEASRSQLLDHIERRWGRHFTEADREMLQIAPEPRWRKTCNWRLYVLFKERLIDRPRRGVQSLTAAGKREAETWKKNLPS